MMSRLAAKTRGDIRVFLGLPGDLLSQTGRPELRRGPTPIPKFFGDDSGSRIDGKSRFVAAGGWLGTASRVDRSGEEGLNREGCWGEH